MLTDEHGIPGSKFEREPEKYTVGPLKRWLKCRGLKLNGKRDELLKRGSDCVNSGNLRMLDPCVDDGKRFSAKVFKENAKLQANCCLTSLRWELHPAQCFHKTKYLLFWEAEALK